MADSDEDDTRNGAGDEPNGGEDAPPAQPPALNAGENALQLRNPPRVDEFLQNEMNERLVSQRRQFMVEMAALRVQLNETTTSRDQLQGQLSAVQQELEALRTSSTAAAARARAARTTMNARYEASIVESRARYRRLQEDRRTSVAAVNSTLYQVKRDLRASRLAQTASNREAETASRQLVACQKKLDMANADLEKSRSLLATAKATCKTQKRDITKLEKQVDRQCEMKLASQERRASMALEANALKYESEKTRRAQALEKVTAEKNMKIEVVERKKEAQVEAALRKEEINAKSQANNVKAGHDRISTAGDFHDNNGRFDKPPPSRRDEIARAVRQVVNRRREEAEIYEQIDDQLRPTTASLSQAPPAADIAEQAHHQAHGRTGQLPPNSQNEYQNPHSQNTFGIFDYSSSESVPSVVGSRWPRNNTRAPRLPTGWVRLQTQRGVIRYANLSTGTLVSSLDEITKEPPSTPTTQDIAQPGQIGSTGPFVTPDITGSTNAITRLNHTFEGNRRLQGGTRSSPVELLSDNDDTQVAVGPQRCLDMNVAAFTSAANLNCNMGTLKTGDESEDTDTEEDDAASKNILESAPDI